LLVRSITPEGYIEWGAILATGWRSSPSWCAVKAVPGIHPSLLQVQSDAEPNGRTTRQFYALSRQGLALVRCESQDGHAVRNPYMYPHWRIGPEPRWETLEPWVRALSSPRRAERLVALTWLGGVHRDGPRPAGLATAESAAQAKLVRDVRADPRVQSLVSQMRQSTNVWIQEAAALAAKPEDRKPR
jgi:hypothetical protein